jgi:hypothetical protein
MGFGQDVSDEVTNLVSSGGCDEGEAERRLAAEQAAEVLPEDFEDEGPKDWQRFYMGYHQVEM